MVALEKSALSGSHATAHVADRGGIPSTVVCILLARYPLPASGLAGSELYIGIINTFSGIRIA